MSEQPNEETLQAELLEKHGDEWRELSKLYLNSAKVKDNSDPMYYRHRCIEGLLNGETNDFS